MYDVSLTVFDGRRFVVPPLKVWRIDDYDEYGLKVPRPRTNLGRSMAGMNARGVCLHKTTRGAKPAKKQNPPSGGPNALRAKPFINMARMPGTKADR